jgi:predicted TIM-barrel fold metal-dependent hydrolase
MESRSANTAIGKAIAFTAAALFCSFSVANASEPYTGPIIDMHLHAYPADGNGPAPNAVCPGLAANLKYDPKEPWPVVLGRLMQAPPCDNPILGPATDEDVRDQTITYMKKYNVRGVLSGTTDKVKQWQAAAPGLFIPGLGLDIRRDGTTPEDIAQLFDAGEMEVLAEVSNQYSGVLADDPDFAPFWKVAAEKDIPVGIHIGVGPPGAPHLYPDFLVQSPLRIEKVLRQHPTLRVYLMHAGYPFIEDLKALLYLYPQLHVGVGVLQIALTREEYYRFLEDLVVSGYVDRIMYGSDQMNWPGAIEEGINAINDAPFLSMEQKKAILHDNAVRFLRLD